jgi:hypothetical protein
MQRDTVPLRAWPVPFYWQPTQAENELATGKAHAVTSAVVSDAIVTTATSPVGSLMFVGMTPCRIADTRDGTFPAGFGPPSLVGNATRTFAIQSATSPCPVPSIAQAYSFNITVVPLGTTFPGNVNPSGALGYLTIWPTGVAQPVVSTLNSFLGTVAANAAIVPAGTNGSVDVFVFNNTDVIIDINGYYAPQNLITLAPGNAAAPALSFAGDPTTGLFSSGAGTLNIATGGTNRLTVASSGNVGIGTTSPGAQLEVKGTGDPSILVNHSGATGNPALWLEQDGAAKAYVWWDQTNSALNLGTPTTNPIISLGNTGSVRIGPPLDTTYGTLQIVGVETAVYGQSTTLINPSASGVQGASLGRGNGVWGISYNGVGVLGQSNTSYGVYGLSSSNYAGYFQGNVYVTGTVTQNSDLRLKQDISNLNYGLPEVMRLRPVSWTWKEKPDQGVQLGLIAQEVEDVVPELVSTDKGPELTKGINYIGLVPVTINAIQQQQAQIEDQQKRIAEQQQQIVEQKEQNRKLEERLVALERLLSTIQPSTTDR